MKQRTDYVSNSSSCSYMIPLSETHDKSLWFKDPLMVFADTGRVQLEFDDFTECVTYTGVDSNWKFLCCQMIYWAIPDILDSTDKTKRFVLRQLYNHPDFRRVQSAVIDEMEKFNISCNGIELDEDELKSDEDGYIRLRPECNIPHDSVFSGLDELLEYAHCNSVAEFIWGIKSITTRWD